MDIELREATMQDIIKLVDLRIQFLDEISDVPLQNSLKDSIASYLSRHLMDGSCFGLLAVNQNQVIAVGLMCVIEVLPDEINESGKIGRLFNIYTVPAYRGKGIMKDLIQKLILLANSKAIDYLQLTAEKKAIPLYKRIGFKLVDNEMVLDE